MGTSFIARHFVIRGAVLWIGARLLAALSLSFANFQPVPRDIQTATLVVALAVILGLVDLRRRRETALLSNLGIGQPLFALWCAVPAACGEILLRLAAGPS